MSALTHEELVERVGRGLADYLHKDGDYGMTGADAYQARKAEFDGMGSAALAIIAESTKDATDEMLAAFIDGDLVPDDYRKDWRLMHARCALWPKDKADASQG